MSSEYVHAALQGFLSYLPLDQLRKKSYFIFLFSTVNKDKLLSMVMKTCNGSKTSKKPPLYKNKTKSTNSSAEVNLTIAGSEKKTKKMEVNRIQQIKEERKKQLHRE